MVTHPAHFVNKRYPRPTKNRLDTLCHNPVSLNRCHDGSGGMCDVVRCSVGTGYRLVVKSLYPIGIRV